MKLLVILLLLGAATALAQTETTPSDPRFDALFSAYRTALEAHADAPYEADKAKLDGQFTAALGREERKAIAAGDLDLVTAIRAERELLSGSGIPKNGGPNPLLTRLRQAYHGELSKLQSEREASAESERDQFLGQLEQLEGTLTKEAKIADALALRSFRHQLESGEDLMSTPSPAASSTPAIHPADAATASYFSRLPTLPTGEWIDVLAMVDPAEDAYWNHSITANQWTRASDELHYDTDGFSGRIAMPVYLGEATKYQVRFRFTRSGGEAKLHFDLPQPKGALPVLFGPFPRQWGVKFAMGRTQPVLPFQIQNGAEHTLEVSINSGASPATVSGSIDGITIPPWSGDWHGLNPTGEADPAEMRPLVLIRPESDLVIHEYSIRVLEGVARQIHPAPEAGGQPSTKGGWENLFETLKRKPNLLPSNWTQDGFGYTIATYDKPLRLDRLDKVPLGDYALRFRVSLQGGGAPVINFPVANARAGLTLRSPKGELFLGGAGRSTQLASPLQPGVEYLVRIDVR